MTHKTLFRRFNCHFPGETGLAGVYWSKGGWRWWWQLDYWSYVMQSSSQIITTDKPTTQKTASNILRLPEKLLKFFPLSHLQYRSFHLQFCFTSCDCMGWFDQKPHSCSVISLLLMFIFWQSQTIADLLPSLALGPIYHYRYWILWLQQWCCFWLTQKAKNHSPENLDQVVLTSGISNSPALILSIRSCGCDPSTVHPTDWHVPVTNINIHKLSAS